jgi:ligand-binding sensor domain-containing protein
MLRFARYRFAVLLVVGTYAVSTAQVHSFQYYTMKEGLLADGINALFQDSRGYLWIGTAEGVSVYDGHGFTSYRARNGLATNFVTCITESRRVPGTIRIGTSAGGVSMFVNGQFTTLLVDTAAKSKTISALLEDRSGTLWCATEGGVYTVRNGRTTKVTKMYRESTRWH